MLYINFKVFLHISFLNKKLTLKNTFYFFLSAKLKELLYINLDEKIPSRKCICIHLTYIQPLILGVNWRLRKTIDANNSRRELMAPISAGFARWEKRKGCDLRYKGDRELRKGRRSRYPVARSSSRSRHAITAKCAIRM